VHRTERLITSSDCANLEMHAYYFRLKRGLSGYTLVMYWDTVYTRSTHGLRVTLVRITPEEPPLTQTHSHGTRLTPRRSRAQAARQQPRPVVDLRRPVHAPPVFIGMNMGANSWSMNASVCVTTSTPPHTHAARTRLAWFPRVTTAAASDPFARPHKSLHQECTASTTHDTGEL
jgi:hypothetical protein